MDSGLTNTFVMSTSPALALLRLSCRWSIYLFHNKLLLPSGLFPDSTVGKNPLDNAGNTSDMDLIPWRRKWQPDVGFLPGRSHGQRSLASHSLQGCTEMDTAEHSHTGHTGAGLRC